MTKENSLPLTAPTMATGTENGLPVGVAGFDFEAVDRGSPLDAILHEDELPQWEFLLNEPRAVALLAKMSRVVMRIAGAANSKMSAECFLIAIGDTGDEDVIKRRITGTARRFGVGKAAASKCCVEWCEYLGNRPSAYMRQTAAKISFQTFNPTRKKSSP